MLMEKYQNGVNKHTSNPSSEFLTAKTWHCLNHRSFESINTYESAKTSHCSLIEHNTINKGLMKIKHRIGRKLTEKQVVILIKHLKMKPRYDLSISMCQMVW